MDKQQGQPKARSWQTVKQLKRQAILHKTRIRQGKGSTLGLGLEPAAHAGVAGLDVEGLDLVRTKTKERRGSVSMQGGVGQGRSNRSKQKTSRGALRAKLSIDRRQSTARRPTAAQQWEEHPPPRA
jgi:hypothetical protein